MTLARKILTAKGDTTAGVIVVTGYPDWSFQGLGDDVMHDVHTLDNAEGPLALRDSGPGWTLVVFPADQEVDVGPWIKSARARGRKVILWVAARKACALMASLQVYEIVKVRGEP
jgi:hypothetical protein